MTQFVKELIKEIKGNIFEVKVLRCDDAGYNMDKMR